VRKLTKFLGRSPDTASAEDLRRFQMHLVDEGALTLPLLDVLHSHSITRLCLAGPRASSSQTASG
jgi:hypothetical protein